MILSGHKGQSIFVCTFQPEIYILVYDRNQLFGLGSDTETETENWPKLLADTETNRNHKILKRYIKGSARNFHVMSITKTFIQYTTNEYHVNQL